MLRRGAAGGSRTRTPIRTQAPQACQSTSSSTAADHSNSTSCLIIILRLALFVNSIFSPARKKTAKKVLTPGTSYGNIFLALNGAKPLARVVELVDSLASGASVRKDVRVRLPPRAPKSRNNSDIAGCKPTVPRCCGFFIYKISEVQKKMPDADF